MLCVRHFLKVGGWFKQQKQNVWVVLQVACLVLVFPAFLYGNAFAWMRSTCTTICRPIQKSDKRDQLEAICTIQIGFQWEMDFVERFLYDELETKKNEQECTILIAWLAYLTSSNSIRYEFDLLFSFTNLLGWQIEMIITSTKWPSESFEKKKLGLVAWARNHLRALIKFWKLLRSFKDLMNILKRVF